MLIRHQFNYVTRSLFKQKLYSLINILGLAVAMASVVIIALWVMHELSYDKAYPKSERIYRFTEERNTPDGYQSHFARMGGNIEIEKYIPEIEARLRLAPFRYTTIAIGENKFSSNRIYFTDNQIFKVFDLKLVQGDTSNALSHPNSVIISEKIAKTYFGENECLGLSIQILPNHSDTFQTYTVTGVFRDLPLNSHLHFDMLTTTTDFENYKGWAYNYVLLSKNVSKQWLNEKLKELVNTVYTEAYRPFFSFHLQSIKDIHLHSKKDREIEQNGNYQSVILLIAASIFIFIIAIINAINLNITQLFKELKYLKISKIFGASASDFFNLQIIKALILSLFASVLSYAIILTIKNFLDKVFWLNTAFLTGKWNEIILILAIISILIVLISSIPVFLIVYKRFSANNILFSNNNLLNLFSPDKKFLLRKLLLIIQFAVSFILILCSFAINSQMKLITSNQLKQEGTKTIVLKQLSTPVRNEYPYFKQLLMGNPLIKGVTASMETPPNQIMDGSNFEISNQTEDQKTKLIYINPVDDTYFKFYNLEMIAGEDFPNYIEGQGFDSYIINHTAMKYLGFKNPNEVVGKRFKLNHGMIDFKEGRILGVVNDFNYASLHHEIEPMVYFQRPKFYFSFFINIDSSNVQRSLAKIQEVWETVYPNYPFEYHFSDQIYQQAYVNEYTQSKLSGGFSVVAIIISITGLIGLTTIMANRRKKEIGIRKVLGASSLNIVKSLSKEFVQLILISLIIATTISYFLIVEWLNNFVYRIDLAADWWVYLLMMLILASLIMFIVTFKALISSRINPIDCIRDE